MVLGIEALPNWIVVAIVAVVVFMIIFKSQDLFFIFSLIKKNLFVIVLIAVFLFIGFSIYKLNVANDIDYTSFAGLSDAGRIYLSWLRGMFTDTARVTGYAIGQDWGVNETVK
jgi:hypothetical protein